MLKSRDSENVIPHGKRKDITQEVPDEVLMSFAEMCIKMTPEYLEALVMTAMHAMAFRRGVTEPQTIQLQFDPKDGPYYEDEGLPPEDGPKIITAKH